MATLSLDPGSLISLRQTRGISLEQIANETKLTVSTLKAIENGDFDALPGGIYTRSYIRQYAKAIGLDETILLAGLRRLA